MNKGYESMKDLVSVIVPIYKTEGYLDKCISSILSQTYENIEIILVDDGSPDHCSKICDLYRERDSRIKVIYQQNAGAGQARNRALDIAQGMYIIFVDSDDYVDLDLYEKMYEKTHDDIGAFQADIVETDFIWEYPDKQVVDISKVDDMTRVIVDIRVVAWNKLYRREWIEKLGIQFSKGLRYEDVDWCYKLIPHMEHFESVHGTYVHYVQRSNSIANTQNEKVRDIYQILKNAITYYEQNKLMFRYKNQLEYSVLRIVFGSSFLRTIQVEDPKLRKEILDEGYDLVMHYFPDWRHNKYLVEDKTLKNRYYRTINRRTLHMYAKLFRWLKRVK